MTINSISDFRKAVRNGAYAWPGGYPLYFTCDDGGALCCKCVKENTRLILEAINYQQNGGMHHNNWRVIGIDINYENNDLYCDHCSQQIESAYAED